MADAPYWHRKPYRMCIRKRRYDTKAKAPTRDGLRAYRCPICAGWHVTKQEYRRQNG